jgi:hypothetical protein
MYLKLRTLLLLLATTPGCLSIEVKRNNCPPAAQAPSSQQEIHVKVPPQKIVIEDDDCSIVSCSEADPGNGERESGTDDKPRPKGARESGADREAGNDSAPVRGATGANASQLGISDTINTVDTMTAMTQPLTQTSPGGAALGLGISWIKIPIPVPRLFTVHESPSIRIPLTQANIMTSNPFVAPAMPVAPAPPPGQPSSNENAQLIAVLQALAQRQQAPAPAQSAASVQQAQLAKEVEAANARVEKMLTTVEGLRNQLDEAKKVSDEALKSKDTN